MQPTDHMSIAEAYTVTKKIEISLLRITHAKKSARVTHVVPIAKHGLRRAIPQCCDGLGHKPLLLRLTKAAREPKIAYLELAILVNKQTGRLEIAEQHVGRVNVFQTAECLVDEGLEVRVRERLSRADLNDIFFQSKRVRSIARIRVELKRRMICSAYDGVKVGFHELSVEIHLIKVPIRAKDNVHVIQAGDL